MLCLSFYGFGNTIMVSTECAANRRAEARAWGPGARSERQEAGKPARVLSAPVSCYMEEEDWLKYNSST